MWSTLLLFFVCGPSFANWKMESGENLQRNTDTTLTLHYSLSADAKAISTGTLWLVAEPRTDAILPETVIYERNSASIPIYLRGSQTRLKIYDAGRGEATTLTLHAESSPVSKGWLPKLAISAVDDLPIVFANQEVTPTLTLNTGQGPVPPSVHISATDHRGRLVFVRFYSTFDLVASQAAMRVPAAGHYNVQLRLLQDDITSLPRAIQREPIPVPFGEWVPQAEALDLEHADYVTTDVILGNIVPLEHLPTTATVIAEDRVTLTAFARHSRDIQKNRWPFMLERPEFATLLEQEQHIRSTVALKLQRMLGSSFVHVKVPWGAIQKAPGSYTWYAIANLLPLYRQNLVRPVITLSGRSSWSNSLPTETTDTLTAWKDLVAGLSEKYQKVIWGLQCWEHPEQTWPEDTVSSYSELVSSTVTAFATKDGDAFPAPPVLAGGTDGFHRDYLQRVLDSPTTSAIGGISFTLFPEDPSASPEENGVRDKLAAAEKLVADAGRKDLPLWLLGTAWDSSVFGVTQHLQANYLVRTHTLALAHNFYKINWAGFRDTSDVPWVGGSESNRGLLHKDFSPKPAGVAYNVMAFMMSGVTPREVTKQGKASIFAFNIPVQSNKWAGVLYVAWTEFPHETQDVLLPMSQGGGVYALDYLGAEVPATNVDPNTDNPLLGEFRFSIGFEPVYIWDAGKPGNSSNPPTDINQD